MLSPESVTAAADQLFEAEQNRVQIRPLTLTYPDMDMDDAYAVQKAWVDRKIADGRRVTGYKIGLTSL
jgi:2-oxo-hept-3-ene-1,7-dioate hydratase